VANGELLLRVGVPANRTGLGDKGAHELPMRRWRRLADSRTYMFVMKECAKPERSQALLTYFFCCTQEV